ncbi:MAG: zinc ribbon domain-containing protein [Verrucomicrobiota bacterium]
MPSSPPSDRPSKEEVTALEKYHCAACGAQAEWNARKQALICGYCGTESPAELTSSGLIQEHDLALALRDMPDSWRGWETPKHTVRCRSCEAITVFDAQKVGKSCDFCGSPELLDYEEIEAPVRPESLLPFTIGRERVYEIIKTWLDSHWLAPSNLRAKGLVDTTHGVYLPYWTFDSEVDCRWTAESGDYYYVTRSVRDSQGNTRQVRERRVRWYPSSGRLQHAFDDHLIPASRGVEAPHLRKVEPFPTEDLVPYDTGYVTGWDIEHYQVILLEAAEQAHTEKTNVLTDLASRRVPGDTHRNLRVHPKFSRETFKHILVPVWILTYQYGSQSFQVVVNAVTGNIAGSHPYCRKKIALLILAGVIIGMIILWIAATQR